MELCPVGYTFVFTMERSNIYSTNSLYFLRVLLKAINVVGFGITFIHHSKDCIDEPTRFIVIAENVAYGSVSNFYRD